MITFKISFLLAFSTQNIKNPAKKDKGTNVKLKNNRLTSTENLTSDSVFDSSNVIGAVRIEYDLVPTRCKYEVDVICWGPIAKMFSRDGQITLKTVIKDGTAWIPVCLEHYLESMNLEEIRKFRDHVVQFNITSIKEHVSNLLKTEKIVVNSVNLKKNCSIFIEIKENTNLDELSVEDIRKNLLENYIRNLIMMCIHIPKNETISWLHCPDDYGNFYEIIEKDSAKVEIETKEFALSCQPLPEGVKQKEVRVKIEQETLTIADKKKMGKDKKTSGSSKYEKIKSGDIRVDVPAEAFFTDPFLSIYRTKNTNNFVKHLFVLVSADQLLTKAQKLVLNSLVIKIGKINNLPVEILKEAGVQSVYALYNIPSIAYCKSVSKPIGRKVKFNEAHIHFTDSVPKIKLIEFIQTQKLFIEIYGNVKRLPSSRPCNLFGREVNDCNISKVAPVFGKFEINNDNMHESSILLAVASYDISSLIDNVWDFKEKGQCHQPNLTLFQKPLGSYGCIEYTDTKNVNEINLNLNTKEPVLIPEEALLSLGTTLQVEVYLMAPQAPTLILHQLPDTFKRICLVINIDSFARVIYNDIIKHNNTIFDEMTKNRNTPDNNLEISEIITGFMIDNGNNFFFFLEGMSTGFILNIWHIVDNADADTGKIYFNTDNAFENRLYSNFLTLGLYDITLKIPLNDILAKQTLYLHGKVPIPCMEALKKLNLLFNTPYYKSILQQNLLPKPHELISLNLEWGVCQRWKEKNIV